MSGLALLERSVDVATDVAWIELVPPPHRAQRVQLLRDPIELSEDDNTYRLTKSVRLGEIDVL